MERPLLLVDIDGVLNPWGNAPVPSGFREYDLFADDDGPVYLAPIHGEWLRELETAFNLVWASSWGSEANRLLVPLLDLHDLPWVPMPASPFAPEEKVPAIAAFVEDRPTAWLDDLMTAEAYVWAQNRQAPTLLIEIDHASGLARVHVERLLDWSARLGS